MLVLAQLAGVAFLWRFFWMLSLAPASGHKSPPPSVGVAEEEAEGPVLSVCIVAGFATSFFVYFVGLSKY